MIDRLAQRSGALVHAEEHEGLYRQLFESASDALLVHDAETGKLLDVNRTMLEMYGVSKEEALHGDLGGLCSGVPPYSSKEATIWMRRAAEEGPQVFDWVARRKNGDLFPVEVALSPVDTVPPRILAVVRDVSRTKQAEEALEHRARMEELTASISTRFVSVAVDDLDAAIEAALAEVALFARANAGYVMTFTEDRRYFNMTHLWSDGSLMPDKRQLRNLPAEKMPWWMNQIFARKVVSAPSVANLPPEASVEQTIQMKHGLKALVDVPLVFQGDVVGFIGIASRYDRTIWTSSEIALLRLVGQIFMSAQERRRSERALRRSEEQLRQAQKMEAIGRLAGGIAHDFNNLLTGILGYADIMLRRLPEDDPNRPDLKEIVHAAERAEALTRQLLAFSRKQTSRPRVVLANTVIEHSRKMLGRMIGEDVDLIFAPHANLWPIELDPNHLDQILINLATNARDAMPNGGTLSIETRNVTYDAADAERETLPGPGDYVRITVSDQGVGIPLELRSQVFEPFYTSKPEGEGTGLGLSTVYGLVHQNRGSVTLSSEVGVGTSVQVHFPRAADSKESSEVEQPSERVPTGHETILLVEDEALVRGLAKRLLTRQGYEVLEAANGDEAFKIAQGHPGGFALLLTDVIMPKMTGPELRERLKQLQPDLRCLYMSGYAENLIVHRGVAEPGTRLLEKPFDLKTLARTVRAVLDEPHN